MSDVGSRLIPKPPVNIALPLLSKGMKRHVPSTSIEDGGVFLASNWNVTQKGPLRRHGSIRFAGGAVVSYAPVRDTVGLFTTNGAQRVGIVDSKFVYAVSGSSLARAEYGTSAGTVKTSGAHLVGNASADWTAAGIRSGDAVELKPASASAQELLIASIISKSHALMDGTPSPGPYAAGSSYAIYKAFAYSEGTFVDWTLCDNKIVFADGVRTMKAWDGSTMAEFSASFANIPAAVAFWADRLFCGNMLEGSSRNRSKIWWSKTTDHTDFGTAQWVGRPYGQGALLRLVPMGRLLIAYYEDRIDIGRPTNFAGDLLPVSFDQLDTGGAGLVSARAVARFYDGHFIMLDDGIYYFSAASGVPQNIGEDIWKEATSGVKNFRGVQAAMDWQGDSVLFGIPNAVGNIACLWRYNYKAKAWSRDEIGCTSLSGVMQLSADASTIDAASGTIDSQTGRFDDAPASYVKYFAFGKDGAVNLYDPSVDDDYDSSTITAVLETPDMSFGAPNELKSGFELSLKTDRLLEAATTFIVEGSVNRGLSWKALGTLSIPAFEDEGKVGFKLMGSTLRIRVTCGTRIAPFTIAEVVMRLRGRGRELRFGQAD